MRITDRSVREKDGLTLTVLAEGLEVRRKMGAMFQVAEEVTNG
jgi:hypothetical protein